MDDFTGKIMNSGKFLMCVEFAVKGYQNGNKH